MEEDGASPLARPKALWLSPNLCEENGEAARVGRCGDRDQCGDVRSMGGDGGRSRTARSGAS